MDDRFNWNVIHMTMQEFYRRQKIVPSVKKQLTTIKKTDFPWQKDVPILVLHDMGFTWIHSVSKTKVFIERQDTDW
jgi:hypothetical protein